MRGQARMAGPPSDSGRSRAPRRSQAVRTGTLRAGPFSSAGPLAQAITGQSGLLPDSSLPAQEAGPGGGAALFFSTALRIVRDAGV